jgi:hypothetical protein
MAASFTEELTLKNEFPGSYDKCLFFELWKKSTFFRAGEKNHKQKPLGSEFHRLNLWLAMKMADQC